MHLLCLQVLRALQPLIVYFPDSSQWLSRAVPNSKRKEFVHKVEEIFNQLSGPTVLICGQNKVESGSKEKEKFVSFYNLMPILKFYMQSVEFLLSAFIFLFLIFIFLADFCTFKYFWQTMILPNFGRLAKLVTLSTLYSRGIMQF